MQSQAEPVHAFKMFHRDPVFLEWLAAVTAIIPKCGLYSVGVPWVRNAEFERRAYLPAEIMKEHADELVSHVGLGSRSSRPQTR
jgi:hypothetical protein